ncbi:MAG: metal-binding protein [Synechococcales cyanobacterium RM1_1_8]|nr:metal-binding protein [Synechococcales cyanobacterium RM1_1_8]
MARHPSRKPDSKSGRKADSKAEKGRLVRNHSTNLQGLLPVLDRLRHHPGIATLTPAVIGRARSHAPQFRLKVSVPTQGGFKLIARQGKTFQEVFVTTHLERADLERAIAACLP